MKWNSIFRIFIFILVILNLYFFSTKFDFFGKNGYIFFTIISIFAISIFLPKEILNVLGLRKVFNLKKFNWMILLSLLTGLIELLYAFMVSDNRTSWYGLDAHHLLALHYVLLIFLFRSNYLMINNKAILLQGSNGWYDSTKIKWIDVKHINLKDNLVSIRSETKKIEIGVEKIRKKDLQIILETIEQNFKKYSAQYAL